MSTDTWYHIACVYDGSTMELFIDGSSVGTNSYSIGQLTGSGHLGLGTGNANVSGSGSNRYTFDGKMGDAKYYNDALTGAEVLQNYNAEKGRFISEATYPNTHSVEFDGINDIVKIGAPITHYGDKTISMWIKPASITTDDTLVACWKNPGSGTPLAMVRFTATGLGAYSGTNNTQPITSILPAVDTWSHICVVWEGTSSNGGGTITGYVNGGGAINMPVTQNTQGGQASAWFTTNHPDLNGGLGLGAKLLSVWGTHYHGKMDEVSIFDAALDATQVASLYNSGTPDGDNILALSPVAWWRMGEGDTYPTITNQVAGGLDAVMTSMDGDEIVEDTP